MKTKKLLKCSLAVALIFGSVGALAGCNKENDNTAETQTEQEKIYKLAVDSGYKGTYEEWLATIKGSKGDKGDAGHTPVITIGQDGYWYVDGVSTNVKATGSEGGKGDAGSTWLSGTSAPNNGVGRDGDFYFDTLSKVIYEKIDGEWEDVVTIVNGNDGNGISGVTKASNGNVDIYTINYTNGGSYSFNVQNGTNGVDAKDVEFQIGQNGYIQWKYVNADESTWRDLIDTETLRGESGNDAKEVTFRVNDGAIQWAYDETVKTWNTLVELGPTWSSGDGAPSVNSNTREGDFYFDRVNNDIYVFDGTEWVLEVDMEEKVQEAVIAPGTYINVVEDDVIEVVMGENNTVISLKTTLMSQDGSLEDITSYVREISLLEEVVKLVVEIPEYGSEVMYYTIGEEVEYNEGVATEIIETTYISEEDRLFINGSYDMEINEYMKNVLNVANNRVLAYIEGVNINGTIEYVYGSVEQGEMFAVVSNDKASFEVRLDLYAKTFEIGEFECNFEQVYENGLNSYTLTKNGNDYVLVTDSEEFSVDTYTLEGFGYLLYVENEEKGVSAVVNALTGRLETDCVYTLPFIGEIVYVESYADFGMYQMTVDGLQIVQPDAYVESVDNKYSAYVNVMDGYVEIYDHFSSDSSSFKIDFNNFIVEDNVWTYDEGDFNIVFTLDAATGLCQKFEVGRYQHVDDAVVLRNILSDTNSTVDYIRLQHGVTYNIGNGSLVVENKKVVLDLNGATIVATDDTAGDGVFQVKTGGELVINGDGTVNGVGNNPYSMAIWANGGKVTINGGTYTNVGAHNANPVEDDSNHYDLIYVKNGGEVVINDGEFICETPIWTLNSNNTSKGTIQVNGGMFYGFNPFAANTDDNGAENNPVNYVVSDGAVFTDGSYYYVMESTVEVYDAAMMEQVIAMAASPVTVKLINDIDLNTALLIDKEITIDLNGCTLTAVNDTVGDGIFHVVEGGKLTINGDGTVNGVGNNPYSMAIWADGGKVTINGGTYTNVGAHNANPVEDDSNHYDLIYVKNGGSVVINDGEFMCETSEWTLNSHNTNKGTITVYGGTFYGVDPSAADTDDNGNENNPVNYVAEGYRVVEVTENVYQVVEE